jgi:hypothetical protein
MNAGITLSLIDAVPVGLLVLTLLVDKAFVRRGVKVGTRITGKRRMEEFKKAA